MKDGRTKTFCEDSYLNRCRSIFSCAYVTFSSREFTGPFLQAISAILQTIIIYINDSRLETTFPCRLQGVAQPYKAREKEGHYLFVFIFLDPTMGASDHTPERNHKDRKQTCENSIENHFTLYNRQIINNKVSSICTPRVLE